MPNDPQVGLHPRLRRAGDLRRDDPQPLAARHGRRLDGHVDDGLRHRPRRRAALVDATGATTWRQFDERVNRLVNGLRATGLSTGDTIAVVVGNRREWFEIAMALRPRRVDLRAGQLALGGRRAGLRVRRRRRGRRGRRRAVRRAVAAALDDDRSKAVRLVVGVDAPPTGETADRSFVAYEDLLAGASTAEPADPRLGGPMFYTSGTTGRPEGRARLAARQQRHDAGDHAAGGRRRSRRSSRSRARRCCAGPSTTRPSGPSRSCR